MTRTGFDSKGKKLFQCRHGKRYESSSSSSSRKIINYIIIIIISGTHTIRNLRTDPARERTCETYTCSIWGYFGANGARITVKSTPLINCRTNVARKSYAKRYPVEVLRELTATWGFIGWGGGGGECIVTLQYTHPDKSIIIILLLLLSFPNRIFIGENATCRSNPGDQFLLSARAERSTPGHGNGTKTGETAEAVNIALKGQ